jgi:hypothetical protein
MLPLTQSTQYLLIGGERSLVDAKCEIIHKYKVPSKYTKTFVLSVHQFVNIRGLAKAIGGFFSNDFTSFYRQRVSIVFAKSMEIVFLIFKCVLVTDDCFFKFIAF